jgi:hypothetical protein
LPECSAGRGEGEVAEDQRHSHFAYADYDGSGKDNLDHMGAAAFSTEKLIENV